MNDSQVRRIQKLNEDIERYQAILSPDALRAQGLPIESSAFAGVIERSMDDKFDEQFKLRADTYAPGYCPRFTEGPHRFCNQYSSGELPKPKGVGLQGLISLQAPIMSALRPSHRVTFCGSRSS